MSTRQSEVLDFIETFVRKNGYSPTLREIGARFDRSPTTIREAISGLVVRQYLYLVPGMKRNIRLLVGRSA